LVLIMKMLNISTELGDIKREEGFQKLNKAISHTIEIPLTIFSGALPSDIHLCRLYFLRSKAIVPREKHHNSIQRLVSYEGSGKIHVETNGSWVEDKVRTSGNLMDRWHIVPSNTWHYPEADDQTWITLAFHTANSADIIDEVVSNG